MIATKDRHLQENVEAIARLTEGNLQELQELKATIFTRHKDLSDALKEQ